MSDSIINQLASMHIDAQIQAEDNFFLDRVISNDLLGDLIFGFSSAGSLLRFSRTCKTCLVIIKSYIARAFNINRHLSRFFPDPIAFRSLQAWTGTLVSGSNALQFFDRSFYPESDLDIYVPGRYKAEVGRWLLSAGYEFKPNSVQHSDFETALYNPMTQGLAGSYTMKGVSAVFTFTKISPSNSEEVLQVQAIIARHTPMDAILLFHSTCLINAIAWDKAYCLYAKGTLEDRRSLICRKGGGPSHETARQKYIDRGWDITSLTPGSNGLDPSFSVGPRWVGDTQTWTIHLDIEGVSPPPAITPSSTPLTTNILAPCSWILHSFEPTSNKMLYEVVRIPHFSAFNYAMINAEARRVFVQMIRKHPELIEGPSFPIQEGRVYDEELIECYWDAFPERDPRTKAGVSDDVVD